MSQPHLYHPISNGEETHNKALKGDIALIFFSPELYEWRQNEDGW